MQLVCYSSHGYITCNPGQYPGMRYEDRTEMFYIKCTQHILFTVIKDHLAREESHYIGYLFKSAARVILAIAVLQVILPIVVRFNDICTRLP